MHPGKHARSALPVGHDVLGRAFVAILAIALLAWPLSGCAIRLAPAYDRTIVDGLTKVNQDTMTLFASVSSGASRASYAKRKDTYDSLIGTIDALRNQAVARPVPRPVGAQILGIGPKPGARQQDIPRLETPTPAILSAMIETLTAMRDADKDYGLRPRDVTTFKGEFVISMDQALTYEKALER